MAARMSSGGFLRRKLIFPVVAAAGLVALAAPVASAARVTSAATGSTASCSDGTLLSPVSSQRLAAGATAYTYRLPSGTTFENIAPPSGFNAATASNTLLSELNMPQRPAGATAMKTWQAQVAPYARSGISKSETFCAKNSVAEPPATTATTAGQHSAVASPLAADNHTGSTIWSGYELENGGYHRVVGHFVQPSTGTTARSMSSWIGLNGSPDGRLIQAGTGNGTGIGGAPFWEQYCSGGSADGCNNAVIDTAAGASPGQTVSMNVAYNGHTAYFQVAINGTLEINTTDPIKSGVTGGVADFITERTSGQAIPSSSNIAWSALRTYASYSSDSYVDFGSQDYYAYELTANGTFYSPPCSTNANILMYPADVSSEGFNNIYCRSDS